MPTVNNGKGRFMGEINVIPLVDVVLVLLIVFMVTAPMMIQGLGVKLPEVEAGNLPQAEDLIMLSVTREGRVFVDETPVEVDGLAAALRNAAPGASGPRVYLRADQDVPYGIVVRVLAETRKAGVGNLAIVTEAQRVPEPDRRTRR